MNRSLIQASVMLFLLLFITGPVLAITRTEIYNSLVARRTVMAGEIKYLEELETKIEAERTKLQANPTDESARATYNSLVGEAKTKSTSLQKSIDGYNAYLAFIKGAFTTQGTGWANLFFTKVIPNFSQYVVIPADEYDDNIQDASNTLPISPFPTVTLRADRTRAVYGETINITATTTGSGTMMVYWQTNNGTLSAATGPSSVITLPTGSDGKDISVTVVANVNQSPKASASIVLTAFPGGKPTVTISTANGQKLAPGATLSLGASSSGSGTMTIEWTCTPAGPSINPATGDSTSLTMPTAGGDADQSFTIEAVAVSAYGLESDPKTIQVVLAAKPKITITANPAAIPLGGTSSISGSLTPNDATVEWSCSGGTISGTGASVSYTAPAATGTYTITAKPKSTLGFYGDDATAQISVSGGGLIGGLSQGGAEGMGDIEGDLTGGL